jgi:hypothetical protein
MIIDSRFSELECFAGIEIPTEYIEQQTLISVEYFSFDNKFHLGQLVVNKSLSDEILAIFSEIKRMKFPIEKVIPISFYNWDDEISMQNNNSSCFNFRLIKGTNRLSKHAFGKAIDINPMQNPFVKQNSIEPKNAVYEISQKGTILENSPIIRIFSDFGWEWGGNWTNSKDYQHFEKVET